MILLIKNGHVINPATETDEVADILAEDGKVVKWKKYQGKGRPCDRRKRLLCYAGIY